MNYTPSEMQSPNINILIMLEAAGEAGEPANAKETKTKLKNALVALKDAKEKVVGCASVIHELTHGRFVDEANKKAFYEAYDRLCEYDGYPATEIEIENPFAAGKRARDDEEDAGAASTPKKSKQVEEFTLLQLENQEKQNSVFLRKAIDEVNDIAGLDDYTRLKVERALADFYTADYSADKNHFRSLSIESFVKLARKGQPITIVNLMAL